MKRGILLIILILLMSSIVSAGLFSGVWQDYFTGRQIEEVDKLSFCVNGEKTELKNFKPVDSKAIIYIVGLYDKYLVYGYDVPTGELLEEKGIASIGGLGIEYSQEYIIYDLEENKIIDIIPRDKYFIIENNVWLLFVEEGSKHKELYYYDFVNKKIDILVKLEELAITEEKFLKELGVGINKVQLPQLPDITSGSFYVLPDNSILYGTAIDRLDTLNFDGKEYVEHIGLGTVLWEYNPITKKKTSIMKFEPSKVRKCFIIIPGELIEGEIVGRKESCLDIDKSPYIAFLGRYDDKTYISLNYASGEFDIRTSEIWVYGKVFGDYESLTKLENIVNLPKDVGWLSISDFVDGKYVLFKEYKYGEIGFSEGGSVETEKGGYTIITLVDLNTGSIVYTDSVLSARYLGDGKLVYTKSKIINLLGKVIPVSLLERFISADSFLYDLNSGKEIKLPVNGIFGVPSIILYNDKLIFSESNIKSKKELLTGDVMSYTLYSCKL